MKKPCTAETSKDSIGERDGTAPEGKLRVFFIPFFASGHMIPMADLAVLFAARPDVEPTMVLTPANAALLRPTLDRAAASGHPVRLLLYPFPAAEAGLPPGLENLGTVPSADSWRVYLAVDLSRAAHERLLREHCPDAVVADIPYWWTTPIAAELGIPRITFHAVGVFPQCVMNLLSESRAHDTVSGDAEPFKVPGLPGPPVELVRYEIPDFLKTRNHLTEAWDRLREAQLKSYGVVVNTFYQLEAEYCELYRRTDCQRAWFVGPVALCHGEDREATAGRGGGEEGIQRRCMEWLETKEPGSVVFVCFGSWCHFTDEQLREIAVGLEDAGKPFLWVVRDQGGDERWMPEGWEKRVEKRGMVVRRWAPQAAILGHGAVGAFLSHCGWNSVLEGVAAGVPMLTWPLVFEQFINERLVVTVAGAGARVWDGLRSTVEAERVVVPAEAVRKAVVQFTEGGGDQARARARELAVMAKAAVAEGGSSSMDLNRLVDELMALQNRRKEGDAGDVRVRHCMRF